MIGLLEAAIGIAYCGVKAGQKKVKEEQEKKSYKKIYDTKAKAKGWNIVECSYTIED